MRSSRPDSLSLSTTGSMLAFMLALAAGHMVVADGTTPSETSPEVTPIARPKYSFLQQNEDWSALRGATDAQKTDFFDPIKYIPLNDDGSMWLSIGGSTRFRVENWSHFGFGAPAMDNDTFELWRMLLHTDVHLSPWLRVYLEGKSALASDRDLPGGKRTLDVDTLDLQQAFADLKFDLGDSSSITVRPGRQMLLFGKQRLVSPLPWGNALRTWDGVSAMVKTDNWNVTGFWTQFAPVRKYDFNEADAQTQLYGVYATRHGEGCVPALDLYFLGFERDDMVMFNGTTGHESRYTLGGRVNGTIGKAFDYDFEGAYQFGKVGMGDVSAFMIATEIGYKLADIPLTPRLFAGLDIASGDDAAGGDVGTFNQLFPLGHPYLGYQDFVGRQNIIDISGGATANFSKATTGRVAAHYFQLFDSADALYNAGGGIVRPGALGLSRDVGVELDFTVSHRFDSHCVGEVGYSHFFPGDFIMQTGAAQGMDFFYFQLEYTF